MQKRLAVFLILAALAWSLAACGGAAGDSSGAADDTAAASQELLVKASNWKFDQNEYTIPKDTPVRITLDNEEGAHGFQIIGTGVKLNNGKQSEVVTLKEGNYDIKCYLMCGDGHLGMKAKLIVK